MVSTPPAIIGWISTPVDRPSRHRPACARAMMSSNALPHGRLRSQIQAHAADLGLVLHLARRELGDDRETHDRGQRRRLVGRVGDARRRASGSPKAFEHAPRLLAGQPAFAAAVERARGRRRARRRRGCRRSPRRGPAAARATPRMRRSSPSARAAFSGNAYAGMRSPPTSSGGGRPGSAITQARIGFARRAGARVRRRCRRGWPSSVSPDLRRIDRREDDDQRVGCRRTSARLRSPCRYSSGPAEATMSTGLPMLASAGRNAARRARVSSLNWRDVESGRLAGVDGEDAGPAGVGDDRDARPAGSGCAVEARRDVEHLVDRVGADDAGLVEQRVDGDVAGGERGGVAAGGARSGARPSGLHRDDRLACARCAARAARTAADCRTIRGRAG